MFRLSGKIIFSLLLLLALFSLPFWLFGLQAVDEGLAKILDPATGESATLPAQAPASRQSGPASKGFELPTVTLVDEGWIYEGGTTPEVLHPAAVFRWDPAKAAAGWKVNLKAKSILTAYSDDEGNIHMFMKGESLITLDGQSGEVLSRYQLKDMPASGANAGQPVAIAQQDNRLYLRNYAMRNNLFVYDLKAGVLGEERWNLCERGYPFDSVYLPDENIFVTFCIDFSSGLQGLLSRLSIETGKSASVEIPALGEDEHMTGNGFALGPDHLAYVVDSDAGTLVEIDLNTMQILRQANYRQAVKESGWLQEAVHWLLDLAATPAQAKRWMSQPAISPDGRYLAVDGGFGIGGGETTSAWLIDLESLEPVEEIVLPKSPQAFHFASDRVLYILLQTEWPGGSQVMAFDLDSQQTLILDIPRHGRVVEFVP